MLICGYDLETTGLSVENDRIIEVGAVLWDVEKAAPVRMVSELVYPDQLGTISPEITKLTGITEADCISHGQGLRTIIGRTDDLFHDAEAIVAHNGHRFDFPFWRHVLAQRQLSPFPKAAVLVDTTIDVPYPDTIQTRNLVHLAAEHGFCNPFKHRAVFDVLTMLHVLSRYPIEEVLKLAKEPLVRLVAQVAYEDRDLAKVRGYHWDAEKKEWFKHFKYSQAETEERECGFLVSRYIENTSHVK